MPERAWKNLRFIFHPRLKDFFIFQLWLEDETIFQAALAER
jgi:hypothetical protein